MESQLPYVKALIDEVGIETCRARGRSRQGQANPTQAHPRSRARAGPERARGPHRRTPGGGPEQARDRARRWLSAGDDQVPHEKHPFQARCTHRRPDGVRAIQAGYLHVEEASSGDRLSVALSGSSPRDRASSRSSRLDSSTSHPGGLLRCTAYSAEVTKWRSLVSDDHTGRIGAGVHRHRRPDTAGGSGGLPRLRRDAPSTGAARRPDSGRARCGWPRGRSRTRGDALRAHPGVRRRSDKTSSTEASRTLVPMWPSPTRARRRPQVRKSA